MSFDPGFAGARDDGKICARAVRYVLCFDFIETGQEWPGYWCDFRIWWN